MASMIRFRKLCLVEPKPKSNEKLQELDHSRVDKAKIKKSPKEWRCIDSCCWIIGYLCTTWWLLLFLYNSLPTNFAGLNSPEPAGARLRRDGLTALHPVILVPGIITGGLELWEGRPCSNGLFRRRLWAGSFTQIFKRFDHYHIFPLFQLSTLLACV